MKSLIRGWRGILLLLFSILLASIIVFLCSSDFVIGTYLLEIVWSLVFFLFLLLCSRNHPVPILWMRGTDIKKVDTAAYCAQLKKPALVFALAVIIPNIVFIYAYLLAQRQFAGLSILWFAVCLMVFLAVSNHRLSRHEIDRR
ncbi:MAG TPA: hypothetical protein H9662_07575 [Firmicutes bacterium]|nr:hypothetical protein [Bacillota bacterium]